MASEPLFKTTGGRRADRTPCRASVQFRSGTRRAAVELHDLSPFGARIGGVFRVHEDDRFFVTLPGIAPIEARVAWVQAFEFGCEFMTPLNPVIFERIAGA